jgi:WD40 repeat protein
MTVDQSVDPEFGGIAISSDGRLLLSWTENKSIPPRVLLWDLPSRKLRPPLSKLDVIAPILHACFSPDGRIVLVSGFLAQAYRSDLRVAQFWDVASGQPVGEPIMREPGNFVNMSFGKPSFRPDGRVVATGGYPTSLWEVPSGKPLGKTNQLIIDSEGWRTMFRPDGRGLYALGTALSRVSILDVAPCLEAQAKLPVDSDRFNHFDVSPDGKWVVTT